MNASKYNVPMSQLIRAAICIYLVVMCGVFLSVESEIINVESILIVSLLGLLICFAVSTKDPIMKPIFSVMSVYMLIHYLSRTLTLLIYPHSFRFPWIPVFYDDYNAVVGFLLLGTIALISGAIFGKECAAKVCVQSQRPIPRWSSKNSNSFFWCMNIALLVVVAETVWGYVFGGIGRVGADMFDAFSGHPILKFIAMLFDYQLLFYIFFAYFMENYRGPGQSIYPKIAFCFQLSLYVVLCTLFGSKAALMSVMMMYLAYKFSRDGDFGVNVKKVLYFLPIIVALGVATFFMGSVARGVFQGGAGAYEDTMSSAESLLEAGVYSNSSSELVANQVSERLSALETLFFIVGEKEQHKLDEHINLSSVFESAIDLIVPGTVFGVMPSTQLVNYVYLGNSFGTIVENYCSHEVGIFGMAFMLGGWWGGCIMIFLIMFFYSLGLYYFRNSRGKYSILFVVWLLLSLSWGFRSLGLDEWLFLMARWLILGVIYIYILQKISSLECWGVLCREMSNVCRLGQILKGNNYES